jgi:hypothetical protein
MDGKVFNLIMYEARERRIQDKIFGDHFLGSVGKLLV